MSHLGATGDREGQGKNIEVSCLYILQPQSINKIYLKETYMS